MLSLASRAAKNPNVMYVAANGDRLPTTIEKGRMDLRTGIATAKDDAKENQERDVDGFKHPPAEIWLSRVALFALLTPLQSRPLTCESRKLFPLLPFQDFREFIFSPGLVFQLFL
jgi:hypothetical protein